MWLSGLSAGLEPQRAAGFDSWSEHVSGLVAGQVPSRGRTTGNHTLMSGYNETIHVNIPGTQ